MWYSMVQARLCGTSAPPLRPEAVGGEACEAHKVRSMKIMKRFNAMAQSRPEGTWQIRVFHRKAVGKCSPRYLIKCGCCDQHFEIYYGDDTLEIAGVMGSVEDWQEILLPLLTTYKRTKKRKAKP